MKETPSAIARLHLDRVQFAKQIKEYRVNAGFTQQEMAGYIGGISMVTIWRWEKGITVPYSKIILGRLLSCGVIIIP